MGSKNQPEDPADWEPKEVSVTITGCSWDIEPGKLDEMDVFLQECCMAGMFALERGGTVSHLHLQVCSRCSWIALARSNMANSYTNVRLCLQGVLRMKAKTVRGITTAIK